MNVLKKIGSILGWAVVILVLAFNVVNAVDRVTCYSFPVFGFRMSVIISDSMSYINDANKDYLDGHDEYHRIYKNDLIMTLDVTYDEIQKYDVITYFSQGSLICHRVVDKYINENGVECLVTRGDANNANDLPIHFSEVRGRVFYVAGGVGVIFLFLQSLYGLLAIFICLFFIFLGMYLYRKDDDTQLVIDKKRKKERRYYNVSISKFRNALRKEIEDLLKAKETNK